MPVKKKPSPAQLAARAKFVAMVRARAAAKKKAAPKVGAVKKKAAPKKVTAKKMDSHKDNKSHNVKISVLSGVNNIMELKRDLDKTILLLNNAKMGEINKNGSYYNVDKFGITTFKNITAKRFYIKSLTKQYKILKELYVNTKKLKLKKDN
jgi:hypothetical protein